MFFYSLVMFFDTIQVMNEADMDNDRKLSFAEFEHIMFSDPNFLRYVQIDLFTP